MYLVNYDIYFLVLFINYDFKYNEFLLRRFINILYILENFVFEGFLGYIYIFFSDKLFNYENIFSLF